ncbi:hypothetical protein HPB51_016670 [Rhipicephalus microplus]|uniref:Uncharacterized protein n=1 Tax=Rhipicephalus microplus TaxID=6941 RepID=A0A9J6DNQ7_RHIMP|nr:hypothetical protein HPB51_016670 [Rhipicephalus microplus]
MERSVSLRPDFPSAAAQRCYVQYRYGAATKDANKQMEALQDFEKVQQMFPNCPECYFLHAQILSENKEFEKAEENFLKAQKADPTDPNVPVHLGKQRKKCAVQPKESSQPAQATSAEPSEAGDQQSLRCSSPTQRQPSIATTSTSGDTRSECHKSSQLPTKISADLGGRAQRIPRRSGVATQAITTATTVLSESADCRDTSTRRQATMLPLVIKTAENAAAADLIAGESVAATVTAACSTSKYVRSSCEDRHDIFDIG